MRVAFSGSHRVGKSTLIERIAEVLPGYSIIEEPYHLLAEEGYEGSETPSLADFEAQLERSLLAIGEGEQNLLFDRCPADIFAYLQLHGDVTVFDADYWLERTREAMKTIDLVVFVPIEEPDRIALPLHEDGAYRQEVHEKLCELLVDDALGLDVEVLIVAGDLPARAAQVVARIDGRGG